MHAFAAIFAASLAGINSTLAAQVVHGRTLSPSDSTPVPGVVIQLTDSAGRVIAQAISDPRGAFTLTAAAGGQYRLRGLRIGFRPTLGDLFTLGATEKLARSLVLANDVVTLAPTVVTATSTCSDGGVEGEVGFQLWEEAKKALLATELTRRTSGYQLDVVLSESRRDAATGAIIAATEREEHTNSVRPFSTLPAEQISRGGYVIRDETGVTFTAPDDEILLSEAFATEHCIRAISTPAGADSAVLEFEPTPDRHVADIRGRIVFGRANAGLRRLEFEYTGVQAEERAAHARGEVHFLRLPTGGWIVDRWRLLLPVFEERRAVISAGGSFVGSLTSRTQLRPVLVARQETVGSVFRVRYADSTIWTGATTALRGIVRDSAGIPIRGALVGVAGHARSARTDEDGAFVLEEVRPGTVQLRIWRPLRDSLGLAAAIIPLDTRDSAAPRALVMPTRSSLIGAVCPSAADTGSRMRGMLRGVVRDRFGSRAGATAVTLSWSESQGTRHQLRVLHARSSATGDFLFCGAPTNVPLALEARTATLAGSTQLQIDRNSRIAMRDITVAEDSTSRVP